MEFFITSTAFIYSIIAIVVGIALFFIGAGTVIAAEDWGKAGGFVMALLGKLLSFFGSLALILWIVLNLIKFAKS